jgi:hypothetical protein
MPFDFSGQWVGESMGRETQPWLWRIAVHGVALFIYPRDEAGVEVGYLSGQLTASSDAFSLYDQRAYDGVARVLDPDHFLLAGFDAHNGHANDVVFSRPGLPELLARTVYRAYVDDGGQQTADGG